jgi:hypothetical protein
LRVGFLSSAHSFYNLRRRGKKTKKSVEKLFSDIRDPDSMGLAYADPYPKTFFILTVCDILWDAGTIT